MINLLTPPQIENIKKQADQYGITIEKAMPIFSLLLREKLLRMEIRRYKR